MGRLRAFEAAALDEHGNKKPSLFQTPASNPAKDLQEDYKIFMSLYAVVHSNTGQRMMGQRALEYEGMLPKGVEEDTAIRLVFRRIAANFAKMIRDNPEDIWQRRIENVRDIVPQIMCQDDSYDVFRDHEGGPIQDFGNNTLYQMIMRAPFSKAEVPGHRFTFGIGQDTLPPALMPASPSGTSPPVSSPAAAPLAASVPEAVSNALVYVSPLAAAPIPAAPSEPPDVSDIEYQFFKRFASPRSWVPVGGDFGFIAANNEEQDMVISALGERGIRCRTKKMASGTTQLLINREDIEKMPELRNINSSSNTSGAWENPVDHGFDLVSFVDGVTAAYCNSPRNDVDRPHDVVIAKIESVQMGNAGLALQASRALSVAEFVASSGEFWAREIPAPGEGRVGGQITDQAVLRVGSYHAAELSDIMKILQLIIGPNTAALTSEEYDGLNQGKIIKNECIRVTGRSAVDALKAHRIIRERER